MKKTHLLIALLLCISCKQNVSDIYFTDNINIVNPNEVESTTLNGNIILDDMVGIGNLEVTNNHLCLFTTLSDTLFHGYSFDGELLAAFGIKGQGPNDFISARATGIRGTQNGKEYLWINDVNTATLKLLNITESIKKNRCIVDSIIPTLQMSINSFCTEKGSTIQEVMTPNNYELVITDGKEQQKEKLYLIDIPNPYIMYRNTMRYDANSNILISAMVSINQINILELETLSRSSVCVGKYSNINNIMDDKTKTGKWVYYTDLRITPNYIYALYMNQNYQDAYVKNKPVEIHIFNKRGDLTRIIHINEYLKNFCITEDDSTIYGLVNDHSIYKYHLK